MNDQEREIKSSGWTRSVRNTKFAEAGAASATRARARVCTRRTKRRTTTGWRRVSVRAAAEEWTRRGRHLALPCRKPAEWRRSVARAFKPAHAHAHTHAQRATHARAHNHTHTSNARASHGAGTRTGAIAGRQTTATAVVGRPVARDGRATRHRIRRAASSPPHRRSSAPCVVLFTCYYCLFIVIIVIIIILLSKTRWTWKYS